MKKDGGCIHENSAKQEKERAPALPPGVVPNKQIAKTLFLGEGDGTEIMPPASFLKIGEVSNRAEAAAYAVEYDPKEISFAHGSLSSPGKV